jgi:hypothetical protein
MGGCSICCQNDVLQLKIISNFVLLFKAKAEAVNTKFGNLIENIGQEDLEYSAIVISTIHFRLVRLGFGAIST